MKKMLHNWSHFGQFLWLLPLYSWSFYLPTSAFIMQGCGYKVLISSSPVFSRRTSWYCTSSCGGPHGRWVADIEQGCLACLVCAESWPSCYWGLYSFTEESSGWMEVKHFAILPLTHTAIEGPQSFLDPGASRWVIHPETNLLGKSGRLNQRLKRMEWWIRAVVTNEWEEALLYDVPHAWRHWGVTVIFSESHNSAIS